MSLQRPFSFKKWIDDNRHLLKPPVGNQVVYKGNEDFIVMVVGGPNSRKDYHYNESEEFFYQLEGEVNIRILENGKQVDVPIKEGEIFLLPARVPHSPQRPANTVGLVMEMHRRPEMKDGFHWYCEKCDNLLYEVYFELKDITTQFPPLMEGFYSDFNKRTCKNCGHVMEPPAAIK
jgi:3-hydroxyanthranilate 3,4-dioxygenase